MDRDVQLRMAEATACELIAQRDILLAAAEDFVRKVDEGRAQSVDSYAKFRAAIARCKPVPVETESK